MSLTLKEKERVSLGALLLITLTALLLMPLLPPGEGVDFYDNTSVQTRLNVSNVAPVVGAIVIHDNDTLSGSSTMLLNQGATDSVYCNGTVSDLNGYFDLTAFNATLFHVTSSDSAIDDNNDHYTSTTCINSTIAGNVTSLVVQCSFNVWFYANNGTWTCNMTATDKSNATGWGSGTRSIDPLYAIDINTTLIDFGVLDPGQSSASDVPVEITNFGNMDLNISVEGFGIDKQDGLAMNCDTGNISVEYEKYSLSASQPIISMTNLTTTPLITGISGLSIDQNIDDNGNSSNSTYWKVEVPIINGLKGFCNGTVVFSAISTE